MQQRRRVGGSESVRGRGTGNFAAVG
jgi:hypothetical protein